MSESVGLKELLRRKIDQRHAEMDCVAALESTDRHLSSDDLHVPGAKDDKTKPIAGELVLGFPRALEALVAVATYGANKYSRGGYLHVNNFDVRYLDAAMRHLLSYGRGDKTDKESGLPHLAHCLWNIAAILEMETRHEESSGS
mgnify:CR=1 FL=1